MAQSDACPNPDLSNGAIVHGPMVICSELDTRRGREDEDGEDEDEEVELAEEVGEDVLMMAGEAEGQVEGQNGEQNESEEVRIIQVSLLPHREIREESEGGERVEEVSEGEVEMGNEEQEMVDEETQEEEDEGTEAEEFNNTNTATENPCHCSAMTESERGQEMLTDNKEEEDREDKEYDQDVVSSCETEVKEDKTNELEEHQVSSTEEVQDSGTEQESGERVQWSVDETDKTDAVPIDGEGTERAEHPIIDVITDTTGIYEQFEIQDHVSPTSTLSDNGIPFDATGTTEVVADQILDGKDKSESSQLEDESINDKSTWQQEGCAEAKAEDEGAEEVLDDVISSSDGVQEIESEGDQKLQRPEVAVVGLEEQSEGGIEETKMAGINQKVEEEQAQQIWGNTLTVMDGEGQNTGEEGEMGDNIVGESSCEEEHGESDDLQMQEEKMVQVVKEAQMDLPEPDLQCVDEVPLGTRQDVGLEQVEQTIKAEDAGEAEPDKPEVGVTSEENESTTDQGGDLQKHPLQIFKEAATDWEEKLIAQLREQVFAEHRQGGRADEDAMMEMEDEPVTVLDDEIEEIEEPQSTESDGQRPVSIIAPSDNAVETKAEEHQKLPEENTELHKENDETQNLGKEEVKKEEKPKDNDGEREFDISERVKELKQALENGSAEPQPLSKDELKAVRVLSYRRKDDDWIVKDQPEEEKVPEVTDWRKELKPVKKDVWETERGRKETVPDKKSPPSKDDWIKELKSVIKDESLPKKRDEQVKKKRVVLLEDGRSYFPRREEADDKKEEVKLISHKKVESPSPPVQKDSAAPQSQDYEISLYVKVTMHHHKLYGRSGSVENGVPEFCNGNGFNGGTGPVNWDQFWSIVHLEVGWVMTSGFSRSLLCSLSSTNPQVRRGYFWHRCCLYWHMILNVCVCV